MHKYLGIKGDRWSLFHHRVGYIVHGYIIKIAVLAWIYDSLLMGMLPQTRCDASLVEGSALHLQSEYPYPNGFLQVLPLSTHLLLCEPRGLAIGLGERLGNTRLVRLLSVVPPFLGLTFLPCGFGVSVVPLVCGRVHPSR